jgi:LPXTG-motif cell wall-anchored protein
MKTVLLSTLVISALLSTQAPSMAQTTAQDSPAVTDTGTGNESDFDMGWIGLLGLVGLAGLAGRRRTTSDYTGTNRTTANR